MEEIHKGKPTQVSWNLSHVSSLWRLTSRVNLARLRDAQTAGTAHCPRVSVRAFLREISIGVSRLRKDYSPVVFNSHGHHSIHWRPEQNRKVEERRIHSLCLGHGSHFVQPSEISAPGFGAFDSYLDLDQSSDSQAFRLRLTAPCGTPRLSTYMHVYIVLLHRTLIYSLCQIFLLYKMERRVVCAYQNLCYD